MAINVSPLIPTETQPGYVAAATTSQMNSGTDDKTFVSPLKAASSYVGYYRSTRSYAAGAVCFYGSEFWRALNTNLGVTPVEGSDWTSTTPPAASVPNATNTTYGLVRVANNTEIDTGTSDKSVTVAGLTHAASSYVKTSGDQDIAGYKTFTSSLGIRVSANGALLTAYHSGTFPSNTNLYNNSTSFGVYDSQFGGLISKSKSTGYVSLDAPVTSPVFVGNPTAPTQLTSDDSTKLATTAFVKAAGVGLGYNQMWQDVKASRSLGTIYVNSTSKPICVVINVYNNEVGTDYIRKFAFFKVDGVTLALLEAVRNGGSSYSSPTITAIVPPGSDYELTDSGSSNAVSINFWTELQ